MMDDVYAAYYHAAGEYDKALPHLTRLLIHEEQVSDTKSALTVKKRMANTYFDKGDYKSAAEIYRRNI